VRGTIKNGRYYLEGAEVTRAEFHRAFRQSQEPPGTSSLVGFKPLHSEALAVHPEDVPAAIEDARKKGVPVDFDPEGRPVFTSSRQFREYARAYGLVHRGY
jgi:sugar/nucleoside kinase (ribokinase family)